MLLMICAIGGLAVGAAVAWLLSANRTRSKYEGTLQEVRERASSAEGKASALEGRVTELNRQAEQRSEKAAEDFQNLRADLSVEKEARVRAETEAKETLARLEEEKKMLAEAERRLTDTFKALAGDVLRDSNQEFLKLAGKTFDEVLADAKGNLGQREEAISGLVKPLSESLKQFEEHVRELEKTREGAYSGIEEHLKNLSTTQQQLQRETGNLVTALRKPEVRGRWGEVTMRRTVELAGMSEHCDFTEQVSVESDEGRLRPDMIIHLPSDREIVIDSKFAATAYLDALEAESDEERKHHLSHHASQTRTHMNSLANKRYWKQFERAPEFVVMFIPGESFLAEAAHHDHGLIEDGMKMGVYLATPTILIALLKAVAYGWRQERIAESAKQISDQGRELHKRLSKFVSYIASLGKALKTVNTAYNSAVGSMNSRVLPVARGFLELGAASGDEIQTPESIETTPRELSAPEVNGAEEEGA